MEGVFKKRPFFPIGHLHFRFRHAPNVFNDLPGRVRHFRQKREFTFANDFNDYESAYRFAKVNFDTLHNKTRRYFPVSFDVVFGVANVLFDHLVGAPPEQHHFH